MLLSEERIEEIKDFPEWFWEMMKEDEDWDLTPCSDMLDYEGIEDRLRRFKSIPKSMLR